MLKSVEIFELRVYGQRIRTSQLLNTSLPPPIASPVTPATVIASAIESLTSSLQEIPDQGSTLDVFNRPNVTIVIYDEDDTDMSEWLSIKRSTDAVVAAFEYNPAIKSDYAYSHRKIRCLTGELKWTVKSRHDGSQGHSCRHKQVK